MDVVTKSWEDGDLLLHHRATKITTKEINEESKIIRPRPHVSGDFCIRKFFYADTKISASTRSVYESYTTVHTYPIRIRTSQRISQQSMRITKKAEPAIILAPNSRLSCLFT